MPHTEDLELALSNAAANVRMVTSTSSVPSNDKTLVKWFKPSLNILLVMSTLNIPSFHASLGRNLGGLGIRAAISVWKAVRTIDSLLVAALMAMLFKADAQVTTSFWFFCCCSLLQAVIGLISSTILIIYFSSYPINNDHVDVGIVPQLNFLSWSVWDLFSVPSIWTSWSILTFTITLLINIGCPTTLNGGVDNNDTTYSSLDSARTLLYLSRMLTSDR
ncbi:hypothetical protein M378DRAFT_18757 [Amanita muscaria Koide BX008]|uniref:Uncharacterized protein n=1 Tax=Amanita muscaria (strain Koide BX008) TaxID=946122 RepID=A0A0C2SKY2_AMAMK|nr:hypothetical protein M378DRAFT_18757 [Amanita muscaria Koide BX008]